MEANTTKIVQILLPIKVDEIFFKLYVDYKIYLF